VQGLYQTEVEACRTEVEALALYRSASQPQVQPQGPRPVLALVLVLVLALALALALAGACGRDGGAKHGPAVSPSRYPGLASQAALLPGLTRSRLALDGRDARRAVGRG
jgi:hypothetical protein